MKVFTLTFILLYLFVVTIKAQDSSGSNRQERKVLRLINNLTEIERANKFMMKAKEKRSLKAYIQRAPTKQQNYYLVSVSEFNGMNLVSHYWFEVDAVAYTISYYDIINNKLTPLKKWQKHPSGVYSK